MGNYVYLIQQANSPYVKIGKTNKPLRRLGELQRKNPDRVAVKFVFDVSESGNASYLESQLHRAFADKRLYGEWFCVSVDEIMHVIYSRYELYTRITSVHEYPDWIIEPAHEAEKGTTMNKPVVAFVASFLVAQVMLIGGISGQYDMALYELLLYVVIEFSSAMGLVAIAFGSYLYNGHGTPDSDNSEYVQ